MAACLCSVFVLWQPSAALRLTHFEGGLMLLAPFGEWQLLVVGVCRLLT